MPLKARHCEGVTAFSLRYEHPWSASAAAATTTTTTSRNNRHFFSTIPSHHLWWRPEHLTMAVQRQWTVTVNFLIWLTVRYNACSIKILYKIAGIFNVFGSNKKGSVFIYVCVCLEMFLGILVHLLPLLRLCAVLWSVGVVAKLLK